MATRFHAACSTCGWTGGPYRSQRMADYAHSRHSCERQARQRAAYERSIKRDAQIDRTPIDCAHPRARHQHGTYAAYTLDRCRCVPCSAAASEYGHSLRRRHAYGQTTAVDAEPVRAHIERLRAGGMGIKGISVASGVSTGTLSKIIYGMVREDGTRRPPCATVHERTARRVLAVGIDQVRDGTRVDALGTRRRVQALVACGWSLPLVAEVAGIDTQVMHRLDDATHVEARTARAVAAAYDELWNVAPPAATRWERGSIARARNVARKRGYAPPLAWDDIDDPACVPDVGETSRGVDLDEWMHLVRGGDIPEVAAQRIGSMLAYVRHVAKEQGRADVLRAMAEHVVLTSTRAVEIARAEALLSDLRAAS